MVASAQPVHTAADIALTGPAWVVAEKLARASTHDGCCVGQINHLRIDLSERAAQEQQKRAPGNALAVAGAVAEAAAAATAAAALNVAAQDIAARLALVAQLATCGACAAQS